MVEHQYLLIFLFLYSQLQWEQYVDHYCRDFPFLFTKSVATDDHVSIDEGNVIVLLLVIKCCIDLQILLTSATLL